LTAENCAHAIPLYRSIAVESSIMPEAQGWLCRAVNGSASDAVHLTGIFEVYLKNGRSVARSGGE